VRWLPRCHGDPLANFAAEHDGPMRLAACILDRASLMVGVIQCPNQLRRNWPSRPINRR
jgi:hypothetical protein